MAKKSIKPMDLDKLYSGFFSALESAAAVIDAREKPEIVNRRVAMCEDFATCILREDQVDAILSRLPYQSVEIPAILGLVEEGRRRDSNLVTLLERTPWPQPAAAPAAEEPQPVPAAA